MAGFADLFSGGYRPRDQGLSGMYAGGEQFDRRVPPPLPMAPWSPQVAPWAPAAPGGVPGPVHNPPNLPPIQPGQFGQRLGALPPGLMRLAGDVVQMPMGGQLDAIRRLIQPGVNPGAQGNLSINQLGPRQLDLLNILRYPGGGQMLPPLGGRRGNLMPPPRGEEFA